MYKCTLLLRVETFIQKQAYFVTAKALNPLIASLLIFAEREADELKDQLEVLLSPESSLSAIA
ncbi:MAG: hypothetical protein AAFV90_19200 [Cyanobacteria bacterium J06634_5]